MNEILFQLLYIHSNSFFYIEKLRSNGGAYLQHQVLKVRRGDGASQQQHKEQRSLANKMYSSCYQISSLLVSPPFVNIFNLFEFFFYIFSYILLLQLSDNYYLLLFFLSTKYTYYGNNGETFHANARNFKQLCKTVEKKQKATITTTTTTKERKKAISLYTCFMPFILSIQSQIIRRVVPSPTLVEINCSTSIHPFLAAVLLQTWKQTTN